MTFAMVPSRRIRRLSLRAPTANLAQHSAVLLADALHTATMPVAEQGRLVVIRRLALGRIGPHASSAELALQIERLSRHLVLYALPADSPAAATAEAVSFRDYPEAVILLARRVAARQSIHEWFWRAVFPEWKAGPTLTATWSSLLELAHHQLAPLPTVAAVVREALRAGAGVELAAGVSAARVRVWLWRLGLDPSAALTRAKFASRELLSQSDSDIRSVLNSCLTEWGARDLRSFWFTAISMLIARPSLATTTDLSVRVRAWLVQREKSSPVTPIGDINANGDLRYTPTPSAETKMDENIATVSALAAEQVILPKDEFLQQHQETTKNIRSHVEERSSSTTAVPYAAEWSQYAGLLFLVPILARLGMHEFLEQNPVPAEAGFPWQFLLYAGKRVGLPESDPLALVLMEEIREIMRPADCLLPPLPTWCMTKANPPGEIDAAHHAWLTEVRRWCRCKVRMGLVTLIRRRGRILASRAHLDICFSLNQADLRIRRQALDVDPGWIPWLGRVIRFHYDD